DGTFPTMDLMDSMGKSVSLSTLYGSRLTIVVFWNTRIIQAREQFERMKQEIVGRYNVPGVKIVAINVGDSAETVQKFLMASPPTVPCLIDQDGEAFKKIAKTKLPRTYLLDKSGKVLWFDLEYSRGMLRDLDNAMHLFLGDKT